MLVIQGVHPSGFLHFPQVLLGCIEIAAANCHHRLFFSSIFFLALFDEMVSQRPLGVTELCLMCQKAGNIFH